MITIFTPSFADEADTNAQNLSVKEIVVRLDPGRFAVTMLHEGDADPRIAARPNTQLLRWDKHGNTLRVVARLVTQIPDIYFFPREGPLDAMFLNLRRRFGLRTAVVTHIVSGGLYSQPYPAARERNIREADAVFANNAYLAELLRDKMGIMASTIHNGIDRRHFFHPVSKSEPSERVIVLYAGSMRPYKRVPLVVEQAARWPNVTFRIAGTGEEEQLCRNLAADRKCQNVAFLGHLTLAQLGDEMRCADIFLFPSIVEGHPQVLGQAAGCGLPVVAMNVYRPDYVVNGTTGFLVESDNELAEKLSLLIREPELRWSMGQAAAEHAKKFDWDVIARQWQDIFEQVVAKRRKD
jgi:glycosyltransferase involved in cell wall biosynthesis